MNAATSSAKNSRSWRLDLQGRLALGLLLLLVSLTPSLLLADDILGHVLEINGDWHLYPNDVSKEEKKLCKWKDVPPGGIIRDKSPMAGDHIKIVDVQGRKVVDKQCGSAVACSQPITLPREVSSGEWLPLLSRVWALLMAEPYQPSLHRMRGAPPLLSEGVARLVDNHLDLGEAMRQFPRGKYDLKRLNAERPTDDSTHLTGFKWEPHSGTARVPGLKTGLYEAVIETPTGTDTARNASFLFLLCDSRDYAGAVASFRRAQALTAQWGETNPETIHAFLRAYLAELAIATNGLSARP